MKHNVNEFEIQEMLMELLTKDLEDVDCEVCTFEDAELLTKDHGVIIKIGGREFQVTIVRSK